MPCSWI